MIPQLTTHSVLRRALTVIVLLVLLCAVAWLAATRLSDPFLFPPQDFIAFWAAGSLNARGENPYDPEKLLPLEVAAGRDSDLALMMWNPPWALTFVMPVSQIEPNSAKIIWFFQDFIVIIFCADWLWRLYGGSNRLRWISWLLAMSFLPTMSSLALGQITPLVLLGLTAFMASARKQLYLAAGGAGVLMAIKPQLVHLFWIALAAWAIGQLFQKQRGWRIVAGGILAGLVVTAIPATFNPHVLGQYWGELTHRPPSKWMSPTLSTLLRLIVAKIRGVDFSETFPLTFIPALFGLFWLLWQGWRSRGDRWDWAEQMPLLLMISLMTAPYGAWTYDLVMVIPALIQIAVRISQHSNCVYRARGTLAYLAINLSAFWLTLYHADQFWYIWMTPSVLIAYLILLNPPEKRSPNHARSVLGSRTR